MRKNIKKISILLLISMLGLALMAGCSSEDSKVEDNGGEEGTKVEDKGTVKLGYVNWAEGIAMTNLAKVILEDKMDYEVEMKRADAGVIFTSVADGKTDAFLDGWLPVTHEQYMEKYKDDLVDLGYNFEGAKIGLVVPEYVDVNSIEELNDNKDKFAGRIIGIDSGAGIMKATKTAIEEYDLDYELMAGSGPVMTAKLKDSIESEEPVIVTGWKPHWKFARWDLKFLEDSKGVYGDVENLHTIVRKGFKEDMPEVAKFFETFKMNDQELGSLMGMIADSDEEPHVAAKEWMKENEDLVNSWIEK
ncbi:glycine betaine ABC transporter substrate-binding protein [Dethiothermospora halolimnae]|uniref:glycine betaine ABC transporter substrate-binding protein n=1 Tax=Dethiothermospora halolimnae TaxID=3114390 RepID=UPI003CCB9E52